MRLLGSGGMGAVYEAENLRTGRRVAIKVLIGEDRGTAVYVRFLREARAASRIVHPNVVQVLDADEDTEGGTPYIVQEYLEGEDLRRRLQTCGRLSVRDACDILVPVMNGLAVAHAAGIVHRDIKPENIFLAKDGSGRIVPRVIDFGVAKLLENEGEPSDDAHLTRTGAMLGTPAYMSPEQVRGQRDLDAQTDVWAVGVVLYEMLSGKDPFARSAANATIAAILLDRVESLDAVVPEVSPAIAAVVQCALDRNRVRRWQSVEAMRDALIAALDGTGPAVAPIEPPRTANVATVLPTRAASEGDAPPPLERRALSDLAPSRAVGRIATGVAVGVLSAIAAAWFAWPAPRPATRAPPVAASVPRAVPPPLVAPVAIDAAPAPSIVPPRETAVALRPGTAPRAVATHVANRHTPAQSSGGDAARETVPPVVNGAPVIGVE